jgi:ribosome-binding factor A
MERKHAKLEKDMLRRVSTILFEVKDPTVQNGMVSVSKVHLSKDLMVLKVWVTINKDEAGQQAVMQSLLRAARFVRGRLGENLDIRHTPEVRFHLDDSPERAARIESLLASVPKGSPESDSEAAAPEDEGDEDEEEA